MAPTAVSAPPAPPRTPAPPAPVSPAGAVRAAAVAPPLPLRKPRRSNLLGTDAVFALLALGVLVVGTWIRHDGLHQLTGAAEQRWTSLARLSGLFASTGGLVGLLLIARPRVLEQRFGLDRLFIWHRYAAEAMAVLLGVHIATSVAAWSTTDGVMTAISGLTGQESYMAMATVGALLIGVVTITSLRSMRRRLAYETWYLVHLLAYIGLAISFAHTITLGTDFADDTLARVVWVAIHVAVAAAILTGRWGRLLSAARHPLRITAMRPVADGVTEITLGGRHLDRIRGDAGQFVFLRAVSPRLWWQAHPFSLSGAPTTAGLRLTVKTLGDASGAITRLKLGTRVVVEGPYGACTTDHLHGRKPLFVAGGVGVAPVRALLERLPANSQPIVLYRAHAATDLVHLDDLRALTAARGGRVLTLVGPTAKLAVKDPFAAPVLLGAIPDVADRVAVLCGPERLLHAARLGLVKAGVPRTRIHFERPWW